MRLGTPAVTTRGMKEPEMQIIADFLGRAVAIAKRIQDKVGKKLTDFNAALDNDDEINALKQEVIQFAVQFGMPGL